MITIHYDFVDGTEISYQEGLSKKDNFTTNCLIFFTTNKHVRVVKKDGSYIDSIELLKNDGQYTNKEIRQSHNIFKMLVADIFEWRGK